MIHVVSLWLLRLLPNGGFGSKLPKEKGSAAGDHCGRVSFFFFSIVAVLSIMIAYM